MYGEYLLYSQTGQRRDETDKEGGCFPKLDQWDGLGRRRARRSGSLVGRIGSDYALQVARNLGRCAPLRRRFVIFLGVVRA